MGTFRHTADDYIVINETLIMPLSFFVTQEPAYALASPYTWRDYEQTVKHFFGTSTTQTGSAIPYTDGDTYIANIATYTAAYATFLATPTTLTAAKDQQKAAVRSYAATLLMGNVVYDGVEYSVLLSGRLHNEAYYFSRIGQFETGETLGIDHYVLDNNSNKVDLTLAEVAELINLMDKLTMLVNQVIDTHCLAIDALGTIAAVLAYDYTTSWPTMPYTG